MAVDVVKVGPDDGGPPADRGPDKETRGGEQLAAAKGRYKTIIGGEDDGAPEGDPGDPEVTLTDDQTAALIEGGWEGPADVDDGFATHGDRISTFVALAKAWDIPHPAARYRPISPTQS